ncbi:MAG: valine--tRNA ligase [Flavobacteriales bacterium]|nr:MAG: valine--tRNA ligase [Flavobacteriales bacterium]
MSISSNYNFNDIEDKWYSYWIKNKYFHSKPDDREPYTIVIPPPNITGILHMGHMLNNTIQDILIRRARLLNKNACWIPGTDHASIATEAKVVESLNEKGIEKNKISREEFIKHAWDWKEKYGGIILEQLKKIGCSCDWDRTKFTLDENMNKSVINVFMDLYNKGLIYRGYRMVNWDPKAKTTLSDEEVNYVEKKDFLYYVKYKIEGEKDYLTIATTRPETILGDSAICVNPNDNRYKNLKGKNAIVPIAERKVPIIFDDYVDIEYGTGCLKVTPAHDINDKSIGDRHDLQFIDIFNEDATLNDYGLHHKGKDRFKARKDIIIELDKLGVLDKKEEIIHNVGISERTNEIIEPKFSHQWFLKMDDLVKPAINSVLVDNEIKLYPNKFDKTFRNWMENIRDWNISRQLYWGHQIPAYFYGNEKNDFVVAKDIDEAIDLAKEKSGNKNLTKDNLRQEEDVLDTWFSSWLWPISVFDGINNPENEDFKYYYPTSDLVTGPDILFFWVSRMIMAGYEFKKEKPFKNVYFTGIVRDKQRRKMSKSLGNSPDALKLISEYGADSVRVGLMLSSSAGNDLLFDESLCSQGRSFANKIWNSYRLIDGWDIKDIDQPEYCSVALNWYENKFQLILSQINDHFDKFRISDALMCVYKLIWDDFCSVLLEILKPKFSKPIDKKTHESLIMIFENNLKLLHPFMPFISEELWQSISERKVDQALVISKWPIAEEYDALIIEDFKFISDVITSVRSLRKKHNISFKESIELSVLNKENITDRYDSIIVKLCNISSLLYVDGEVNDAISFRVKTNTYYVPLSSEVNIEDEILKLENELSYNIGFLNSVDKKLSNKKFVKNAPEKVIEIERKKKSDAIAKIDLLKESVKKLKS